jgi:hypothetical protein
MKPMRIGTLILVGAAAAAGFGAPAQEPASSPSAAASPASAPPKTYYDGVELTISGKAKAGGVLVVVLQSIGGDPKSASVNVLAKMGENDIAEDVAKELTVLSGNTYKVKTKSGNRIVITKAAKNSPNMSLALGMQTVPGIAVTFGEN